jgi:hypothetical protein
MMSREAGVEQRRRSKTSKAIAAVATPSHAHDYSTDFVCDITDTLGNQLTYSFANNTNNADGSAGGTYVETGFVKNGQPVVSPAGLRPIWYWTVFNNGSGSINSAEAPDWRIGLGSAVSGPMPAVLFHDNRRAGWGSCLRHGMTAQAPVTDQVYD